MDVAYPLSGFAVGALAGLTGMGGGSVMTPLLILFFGVEPAAAVGTDLLFAAVTKATGAKVHAYRGNVDWRVVGLLAAGSLPAALVTICIITRVPPHSPALEHARPAKPAASKKGSCRAESCPSCMQAGLLRTSKPQIKGPGLKSLRRRYSGQLARSPSLLEKTEPSSLARSLKRETIAGASTRRPAEQIVLQDYFDDGSGKAPRYYQVNAVNAAMEAMAVSIHSGPPSRQAGDRSSCYSGPPTA